jgi:hypothetical protein
MSTQDRGQSRFRRPSVGPIAIHEASELKQHRPVKLAEREIVLIDQ